MPDPDENLIIAKEALGLIELGEIEDATVPMLIHRLAQAERISAEIKEIKDALVLLLADRMEQDDIKVPGVGWAERRPKAASTAGSDWKGARRDGEQAIVRKVAMDKATGELRLDWQLVASEALELMARSFSVGNPLMGFEKALGLQLDEYIRKTPAGFNVKIVPEGERAEDDRP